MATEVTLPALGESVTEGTVTRWLKQVGDQIAIDEPLLEVSTDKVDTEIPSPVAGTLVEIRANEDDTVEVGAVLAVVGEAGEAAAAPAAEAPAAEAPAAPAEPEPAPAAEAPPTPAAPETPSAPAAPEPAASGAAEGTAVTLPALGESVTEGTVTRWLKQVGDAVAV
ncbi:biotin/lipoyl-containing protein, partial [Nocardioides kongjuensis]